ncbi:SDR family oxidoreductase [Cyclobacteriaceae bacterium]|nr:SDR family oxidoreductase [Cyclobacteriaceae bacterium]
MTKIDKKIIWVTGASSGIGEALVYQLNQLGAQLIISARRAAELARVKEACKKKQGVHLLTLDLSETETLEEKCKQAIAIMGPIDIIIHCGGISQRDKVMNTSLAVDRRIMEVNYFGTVALSKFLLPSMVNRKAGHHVIITSVTGIISTPLRSAYAASKHALHGFFDALRAEHEKDNIHVSLICPGYIKTKISFNALMGDGSKQNTMDKAQDNGMSPERCASKIISAIERNKNEVYIGGLKEVAGIYLKRFFPGLFAKVVIKMAVT